MQIAFSLVLLVSAALPTRGLASAVRSDLGFSVDGVLVVSAAPPAAALLQGVSVKQAWLRSAIEALEASGFGPVGVADIPPLQPSQHSMHARLPAERDSDARWVQLAPVSPGYFQVLGLPLVTGRPFEDRAGTREVVVNETCARMFWPAEPAVGQRIVDARAGAVLDVVGVVRDSHVTGLDEVPPLLHRRSFMASASNLLVRTSARDAAAACPRSARDRADAALAEELRPKGREAERFTAQ